MKKTIGTILAGAVVMASGAAYADCNSAAEVTASVWKKYHEDLEAVAKSQGGKAATAVQIADQAQKAITWYNSQVGNSWAKIGPRLLTVGSDNKGTVQSAGDRAWTTAAPVGKDTNVTFKMTGGKGKAVVSICEINKDNKATPLKEVTIDDGKTEAVSATVHAGSVIKVVVDGKDILHAVEYDITAK